MRTYEECEEYLLNIPKFKKKTLLSDTKKFYKKLNSPGKDIPRIHVAGTNGKGSTCFYTSQILKAHGLKAALFTSPHLVSMKERFCFDGDLITDEEFIGMFERVSNTCALFDENEKEMMHPSFFEYLFLMFMEWADEKKADVVILETGLGGALDATNIFDGSAVSAICSIGMDHMEQLGDRIEEIAIQKAGIIKENSRVVLWDNGQNVNEIILKEASRKNAKCFLLKEDNIKDLTINEKDIAFSLNYYYDNITFVRDLSVRLKTKAIYQRINSSMSVLISKLFLDKSFDDDKAVKALSTGSFKGRFEEISPGFFVDGAHNPDAICRLLETLEYENEKTVLIFGACQDKDYKEMIFKVLRSKLFEKIIFTVIDSPRAIDSKTMGDIAKDAGCEIMITDSVKEAIKISKRYEERKVIAGSLYLVGEAIRIFAEEIQND